MNVTDISLRGQIIFPIILTASVFGLFTNSICILVITFSSNTSSQFFVLINHNSVKCFLFNLNTLSVSFLYLIQNDKCFHIDDLPNTFCNNWFIMIYGLYVFIVVADILSTYGICLEIFLILERIRLYKPSFTFLKKTPTKFILIASILYSTLINTPLILSRKLVNRNIWFVSNETTQVYSYGMRTFEYDKIFKTSVLISYFLRDFLHSMIMMIMLILLRGIVKNYHSTRQQFNMANPEQSIIFKRSAQRNCMIAFFMCTSSGIGNACNCLYSINILLGRNNIFSLILSCLISSTQFINNSINFFIILKFNNIFKRNFYSFMANKPNDLPQVISEHINSKTVTTYL